MASRTPTFEAPRLGFALRRPHGWRFERPAWSPDADPLPLASADWRTRGRQPFLVLRRDGCEPRQPRPSLRVCCRPLTAYSPADVRRLLEQYRAAVAGELDDAQVLTSSFDAIVGGCRAAHVRIRYSLAVVDGRRTELWRVQAESWLVLAPGLAFTIGATSCAEERRFDEDAFAEAVGSVRIARSETSMQPPAITVRR